MPKVILVTSEKGGVGKSTLSFHVAGALAQRGFGTLLIDEDGRVGSSLKWYERSQKSAYDIGFKVRLPDDVKDKHLKKADVVLIDTEGHPKRKELKKFANKVDRILIPCGVSQLEVDATYSLLDFLEQETKALKNSRVVLNRVPPIGHAAKELREDLRDAGATVCNTLVRQYTAYIQAAEAGCLCRDLENPKAAQAWQDVMMLSQELL